jgi:hypothetical protein
MFFCFRLGVIPWLALAIARWRNWLLGKTFRLSRRENKRKRFDRSMGCSPY